MSKVIQQPALPIPRANRIDSAIAHSTHPLRVCHGRCGRRAPSTPTAPGSHAQPPTTMTTVVARALKTPRCSRNLLEAKFRANAPNGVAVATSVYLCPRRSLPTRCRRDAPHKTAHAPRQRLAQAGAGSTRLRRASKVSSVARLLRVFDRLPTGSFQQQRIRPSGPSIPPKAAETPRENRRQNIAVSFARFLVRPPVTRIVSARQP